MEKKNIAVAIDIGTTKIYVLVAEVFPEKKEFQVIGHGLSPSRGLSKGVIVDVEQVAADVEKAIQLAEASSGVKIESAAIGVAGKHIESLMSHATAIISKYPKEITETERAKLEEIAISKVVPIDRKVIHKIVYNYRIDNSGILKNPIGMTGIKLEADVHIVTGIVNSIESLVNSVNRISVDVDDVVLEPLASAKSVLTNTEKKLGAILVDIGGGTTDIAIYKNEKLIYTNVIPLGGEHFTYDIASLLNIDIETAGRLKKEFSTHINEIDLDDIIEVPSYQYGESKEVELHYLKEIIDSRIDDILENVFKKIEASGFKHYIPNGIVFTGGASKVAGLIEKAENIFDMPVRLGTPLKVNGFKDENINRPEYATGAGLLLYAVERQLSGDNNTKKRKKSDTSGNLVETMTEKIKDWFTSLF